MVYIWQGIVFLFIAELFVTALLIGKIGFLKVFLLWFLSAVTGGYLARHGGLTTLFGVMTASQRGQKPAFEGIFVVIAGLLFIFPGFLTDIIAITFLIPSMQAWLKKFMEPLFSSFHKPSSQPRSSGDDVIEGDFKVVEENPSLLTGKNPPQNME